MSWLRLLIVPTLAVLIVGCGGGLKEKNVKPPERTSKDLIKMYLEEIANTGQGGSAFGAIIQEAEAMKRDDPSSAALADELVKDANDLMKATDENAIKTGAKALLDKLGGGGTGG